MSAPTLQPLAGAEPLGTPASEWAQQTVQAIDPGASTGLVTDAQGNPTSDHGANAIGGAPGHGINSDKTPGQLEAIKANAPKATEPIPLANHETGTAVGNGAAHVGTGTGGVFTDAQGNPTTDPKASALQGTPAAPPAPGYAANSAATTPGVQLPGGWIRGPESRQNSMAAPQTSLYEDVSSALDTIGQAAFSAIPPSVLGNLSNSPPAQSPALEAKDENGLANAEGTPKEQVPPSPPARTASPGFLSRAQGMLSGFLARPASPAAKLPAPDAPTTTGEAALVGGGAVATTANELGDNIASGQHLGGNDPKGVLADEPNLLSETTAPRTGLPEGMNTAAKFLNPDIATPDPSKPPHDPGLSGSVFPTLADDPSNDKTKAKQPASPSQPIGSTLSTDADVQAAASKSNQNFSTPISPGASKSGEASEADRPQPTVTKVSGSGVKDQILNVRDAVVAPFAGSRAPNANDSQQDVKTSEIGSGVANVNQSTKASGNAEGIRTTENPHTAHTELAPVRESGVHVGGTGIAGAKTTTGGADGKNLDGTTAGVGNGTTGNGITPESNGNADLTHIPGVSTQGAGQGKIIAHEDGGIKAAEIAHAEKEKEKEKEKSGGGGVSRLWSRSRTSVDAAGRRGSVDEASKSPTGTRRSKSRFNEEGAGNGSESGSTPASPSSSRIKVPLKDKIKGELKIISGKMSKNEAKVEQGIALKTGHASEGAVSPK